MNPSQAGKPSRRQLDRRREELGPRQPAVAVVGVAPRSDGAGDGDRQRPAQRQPLETRPPERLGVGAGGRAARPVERELRAARRRPRSARTRRRRSRRRCRHDHRQDRVRGDRRVDGRAARPEDRRARPPSRGGAGATTAPVRAAGEGDRDEGPAHAGQSSRARAPDVVTRWPGRSCADARAALPFARGHRPGSRPPPGSSVGSSATSPSSLAAVLAGTFTLRFSTGLTGTLLVYYLADLPAHGGQVVDARRWA